MEQWLVDLCRLARARGHSLHLFIHEPVHSEIAVELSGLGIGWTRMEELEAAPLQWSRRLRRDFDVFYLNLVAPRGRAALAGYLAWPLPVLFFEGTSGRAPWSPDRSLMGRILDPLTFIRVAGLAGASRYVVERDRIRFKYPVRRSTVIYNGVDVARFHPPAARTHRRPMLVAVANLIREKGLDVLLEACQSLQQLDWTLRIVGDGPEEPRLRSQAEANGLSGRVEFLGLRDDVERVLQESDIYVHPAVWDEAFGLTIAEAMACECATLATRAGGIPEIVEDGVSGLLVPPGDSVALAAALRRLLEDGALRARLAQAGRKRIAERFTLEASVSGQLDWIERAGKPNQEAFPTKAR